MPSKRPRLPPSEREIALVLAPIGNHASLRRGSVPASARPIYGGAVDQDGAGREPQATDLRFMMAVGTRHEDAFRMLFTRYAPMLTALATRIVRDPTLAGVVTQEVFLAVWECPAAYREDRGTVRAWLTTITHHRAVDQIRREESQRSRSQSVASFSSPNDSSEFADALVEDLWLKSERIRVRDALASLSPEQRDVIELMYFGGGSGSEVARDLQIPLGTVKSRARSAIQGLRRALDVYSLGE